MSGGKWKAVLRQLRAQDPERSGVVSLSGLQLALQSTGVSFSSSDLTVMSQKFAAGRSKIKYTALMKRVRCCLVVVGALLTRHGCTYPPFIHVWCPVPVCSVPGLCSCTKLGPRHDQALPARVLCAPAPSIWRLLGASLAVLDRPPASVGRQGIWPRLTHGRSNMPCAWMYVRTHVPTTLTAALCLRRVWSLTRGCLARVLRCVCATCKQWRGLRSAFAARDSSGTGTLPVHEFRSALHSKGIRLGTTEFERLVSRHAIGMQVRYNDFLREHLQSTMPSGQGSLRR